MDGIPFLSKMVLLMADGFDIGAEPLSIPSATHPFLVLSRNALPLSIQSATQPFLVSSRNALSLSIKLCEIPPFV